MENTCRKILRRGHLRQSQDNELAQLEAQFRNAYVMKALEAQLAEKHADRIAREIEEKLSQELIALEEKKVINEEKRRSSELLESRMAHKKVLEEQIALKEEARRHEEAIAKEERMELAEIDELMDKVHELAKQQQRDYDFRISRHERMVFKEIRAIKKVIEEEKEAAGARRDLLYVREVERRSHQLRKIRDDQLKRREELIEAVTKLFVDATLQKGERETIIGELVAEEIRHEALIEEREREEMAKKKRKELAADLMEQMLLSVQCEARARERDEMFAKEIMKKLMIEDTTTKLTAEAKRRKQFKYKEDLEKLILQRKHMREEISKQIQVELNESRVKENTERLRISAERRKLIEQHAGNVAAYLRKGVLSEEEEKIVKELVEKCNSLEI